MKNTISLSLLLLFIVGGVLPAAPESKSTWPKGIDPASLPSNHDPEPDLNQAGFTDLFNGRDLSGWKVQGGKMQFEADNGTIVGKCVKNQPNGFLCTKETFRDFIFTAEFKWDVPGNSGIMFRAGSREVKPGNVRVFGYQGEMDHSERRWTGGIYGEAMGGWKYPLSKPHEHKKARAAIQKHKDWNRMTIYAKGNDIKTWINGVPCAHLVNDERSEGFFGLQVHAGKQGTIRWKNIRIMEIP